MCLPGWCQQLGVRARRPLCEQMMPTSWLVPTWAGSQLQQHVHVARSSSKSYPSVTAKTYRNYKNADFPLRNSNK